MLKLLVVEASPRGEYSISRNLARTFVEQWKVAHPDGEIVERDLALLRDIERTEGLRPHLHVQHVSTARALEAIRGAKRAGLRVSCEAAPHHFTLTEEAIAAYDTNAKMNPPLRGESDRDAVVGALLDGTVDCIATDHAPHARHEKEVPFDLAPNGMTGLETALGLTLRVLPPEQGGSLSKSVTLMSTNPAKLIGRPDLGTLQVGSAADVAIFDAGARWRFRASESLSRSKNTPFEGVEMRGRVRATIADGRVVFRAAL